MEDSIAQPGQFNRKLHVVFPVFSTELSGGARITLQHAEALAARGHRVTILIYRESADSSYLGPPANVAVENYASKGSKLRSSRSGSVLRLGWRIPACDVIVANSWQAVYPAMIGAFRHEAKVVFLVQHHDAVMQGKLTRGPFFGRVNEVLAKITYRLPVKRVAVSTWVAETLANNYGSQCTVVPNGVNLAQFHPSNPNGMRSDGSVWVMVLARKHPWKGFADAVSAIRIARRTQARIKMLVVTRDEIVPPSDIPCNIAAPADDSDLQRLYCTADLVLFPSHSEGFGLPALEAMACGRPLVVTDCGGVMEFARDRHNCLVVPVGKPEAQAAALLELVQDTTLAERLSRNALTTAQEFSVYAAGARFCDAVEAAVWGT